MRAAQSQTNHTKLCSLFKLKKHKHIMITEEMFNTETEKIGQVQRGDIMESYCRRNGEFQWETQIGTINLLYVFGSFLETLGNNILFQSIQSILSLHVLVTWTCHRLSLQTSKWSSFCQAKKVFKMPRTRLTQMFMQWTCYKSDKLQYCLWQSFIFPHYMHMLRRKWAEVQV